MGMSALIFMLSLSLLGLSISVERKRLLQRKHDAIKQKADKTNSKYCYHDSG